MSGVLETVGLYQFLIDRSFNTSIVRMVIVVLNPTPRHRSNHPTATVTKSAILILVVIFLARLAMSFDLLQN